MLVLDIEKNKVDLIAPDAEMDLNQLKNKIESDKVKLQEINE